MYSPRILFSLSNVATSQLRSIVAKRVFSPAFITSTNLFAVRPVPYNATVFSRSYAVIRGGARPPLKKVTKPKPRPTQTEEYTQQNAVPSAYQENQQATPSSNDQHTQQYFDGRSAAEHVNESLSLQQFLKRSMTTTAIAVGGSTLATTAFMQIPAVLAHPYICLGVGLVGSIGALFGMGAIQPNFVVNANGVIKAEDPQARVAMFGGLLVAQGLALAPLIAKVAMVTPMAIPVAGALSVATMAGMCAYALKQPQGAMLKWGPALYVGMFGLIGTGLLNMFIGSSTLSLVTAGAGILIFSGFTAYDTHVAIQEHAEGRPDHLITAANFYMNFVNLFLDYLRLIQGWFAD